MITRAGLLIAALAAVSAAQAQTPRPSTTGTDPSAASSPHQEHATGVKASDPKLKLAMQQGEDPATFVKNAALDGMAEVELAKIALSKSQDPKVKEFAQRMVKDHSKANMELTSLATKKGMEVPNALDEEHQSMVQMMNAKSGAAFDKAYGKDMAEDHAKAVALFQGASRSSDKDLASFARKTLPTLKEHKMMAESLPGASGSASAHE